MSKVIKINLNSSDSIEAAIAELERYKEDITTKLTTFISVLQNDGISVARTSLASTVGDSTNGSIGKVDVDSSGDIISATIYLSGNDALFIEFGSGIAYNTGTEHPYAGEFGYGVGTYPSEHPPNRAINPGYWYYGSGKRSIGTGASMPMYNAAETMRNNLIMRALEIFRS